LLRPITLHECRHTFASLLIYGHLLPGSHDEVRKRMDAYLRGDDA
jgi:hypothetical protein